MKIKFSKDKNKRSIAIMAALVTVLLVSTIIIQFKSVDQYKKSDLESLREDELKHRLHLINQNMKKLNNNIKKTKIK